MLVPKLRGPALMVQVGTTLAVTANVVVAVDAHAAGAGPNSRHTPTMRKKPLILMGNAPFRASGGETALQVFGRPASSRERERHAIGLWSKRETARRVRRAKRPGW